jgi:uncharacterized RDD family membrane protein YckC
MTDQGIMFLVGLTSILIFFSMIYYLYNLMNYEKITANPPYFIRRCLALMIDAFLLYKIINFRLIPSYYENDLYGLFIDITESSIKIFLYFTILTISPFKSTIGKRLFNIQIASTTGEEIKLHQVLLRSFIQIISLIILAALIPISLRIFAFLFFKLRGLRALPLLCLQPILIYLPILFSKKNLTIHDIISKTHIVINKGSNKFITIILWIFLATYIYLLFN